MARLDRLQPVKEVAQIAACVGREFDYPRPQPLHRFQSRNCGTQWTGLQPRD